MANYELPTNLILSELQGILAGAPITFQPSNPSLSNYIRLASELQEPATSNIGKCIAMRDPEYWIRTGETFVIVACIFREDELPQNRVKDRIRVVEMMTHAASILFFLTVASLRASDRLVLRPHARAGTCRARSARHCARLTEKLPGPVSSQIR
ncbi:uncharacterized protein K489DRAFT_367145 [Dissoconium aciculare CBS 342.82]|uniref:Uncharacterized protein n=1 Tax=Dissoconium aciculare CBS 342.82 TaxID=1314786 RepID=A0A6J3MCW3_9PEZI|nr:uncharacterized protein K489DRAFT_367145 [Dissoconium aciculare CBS 342.82]KAF1825865.1 hypothetical protein K489DRAFT_367145 [Dissoconium aciculare CBS 342.82]